MILALDVGNTQIYGGVFGDASERPLAQFRKSSKQGTSSDELGLFLCSILHENKIDPKSITQIGISSVVPDIVHSLRNACKKYFNLAPFILQNGTKTGLRIRYRNPLEVGADRIANSIAAVAMYPGQNLVIVDLGTATTFDVVTSEKDYLGGLILPGLRISMEALEANTAKLPKVEIVRPSELVGRSTVESIQSGLYYSHLSTIQGVSRLIREQIFEGEDCVLIGTGGFSRLFEGEKLFDRVVPDLVLTGIRLAIGMNPARADGLLEKPLHV